MYLEQSKQDFLFLRPRQFRFCEHLRRSFRPLCNVVAVPHACWKKLERRLLGSAENVSSGKDIHAIFVWSVAVHQGTTHLSSFPLPKDHHNEMIVPSHNQHPEIMRRLQCTK